MKNYLRFLCYNDPDRTTSTQIHPDILVDEPPQFGYGKLLKIGAKGIDSSEWPSYAVANISFMEEIKDPDDDNKIGLVYKVFVAPLEQFSEYPVPDIILEIIEEKELEGEM